MQIPIICSSVRYWLVHVKMYTYVSEIEAVLVCSRSSSKLYWAHSAVVARPLCKRKAPGSIPGVSNALSTLCSTHLRLPHANDASLLTNVIYERDVQTPSMNAVHKRRHITVCSSTTASVITPMLSLLPLTVFNANNSLTDTSPTSQLD